MTETPTSTYRLQLNADFGFAAAQEVVDLLADLGISHVYLSPILAAAPGSTHGYDVADPTWVSDVLGGESGFHGLTDRATASDLGVVVDIVPNHMAADTHNPYWEELLRSGRAGQAGAVFDVDWAAPVTESGEKVILPVLADAYGDVLERGDLSVVVSEDTFAIAYFENRFPLSPDTIEAVERAGGAPAFQGSPGDAHSFDRLHALLEAQHYRLVHWRIGDRIINYRRFFTITDLAAVRVEDEEVFDLVHGKILDLVEAGLVHGLRVDHPDGLRDPARYFERLAERSGGVWTVAEKITHPGEDLSPWPVAGTTGYEFCNDVMGVLAVDPSGREVMDRLDTKLGGGGKYAEHAVTGKREIVRSGLAADTDRVAELLWQVTQRDRAARDVDLRLCHDAVVGLVAGIPVYRPYVDPVTGESTESDRVVIEHAVEHALAAAAAPPWLLEFAGRALAGLEGTSPVHLELIARFPQLSSAAMAKGTEDTAFYRYRRFLALNEVGGDPGRFGVDVADFHATNAQRAERHPTAMLTTATHDTKRGEDTRLRMAALSEIAGEWSDAVQAWWENPSWSELVDGQVATLVWQTMIGIWPLDGAPPTDEWRDRLIGYVIKAEREAAERTLWTEPDEAFEIAVADFVAALLNDSAFVERFARLADRAAELAMVTGLSQVLLRCTAPGVPDTYQGMELWDDHLVDPDNRRPVDWEHRRAVLTGLADADPEELWIHRRDGRVKARVLQAALLLRQDRPELFGPESGYTPLAVNGAHADRAIAFVREHTGSQAVVVATRLPGGFGVDRGAVGEVWGDTTVDIRSHRTLRDSVTGHTVTPDGKVALRDVLGTLPVALLVAD